MMPRALTALIALVAVWLAGQEIALRVGGMSVRPANVILITLDTTRADRLPPYDGGTRLPAVERLSREGVVFDRVVAPVPLTLPSHSSLFTGRLPPGHDVRVNAVKLRPDLPLFTEYLRAAGYRTGAFVGSIVLDGDRGLRRGFDHYGDVGHQRTRRPAREVTDEALSWLGDAGASPFFLWVHYFDAHAPYADPDDLDASPNADPYNGALAIMDAQIARLIRVLETAGSLDRSAIIVTADHGESLGDHGELGHGIFVYESAIRVPLIVRWPGVQPRRVPDLVQLVDIAPTILALERLAVPAMDGVSLEPLLFGRASAARTGYAESLYPLQHGWSALRTVRDGRFKVIEAPRPELYDLEADPNEERNIYDQQPTDARKLLAKLRTFGRVDQAAAQADSTTSRERLASLGYASASPAQGPAVPSHDVAGSQGHDCRLQRDGRAADASAEPVGGHVLYCDILRRLTIVYYNTGAGQKMSQYKT